MDINSAVINSMIIDNKCYGCTRRTVTCHANCEDYKEFLKRNEKRKERIRKESESVASFFDGIDKTMKRNRKGMYKR